MSDNSYNPRANAGLPDQADYDPSALGASEFRAGDSEQQYPEYGLELAPLLHKAPGDDEYQDTGRRVVLRNGEYIADVSDGYRLLPNERVVEVADEVADNLGAVPFNEFGDDDDWFVKLHDHVYQDEERRRVHALYAWDDPVDLGGDDTVQMGFAVHNSIDGSLSFSTGLFSFRHACQNMVTMTVDHSGQNVEEERDIISKSSHAHTKGLDVDPDLLQARIESDLFFADEVTNTYQSWRDQFISYGQIEDLIDRLPTSDLPEWLGEIEDDLDRARDEEEDEESQGLTQERRREIIDAHTPDDESAWDVYNDITESIWHSETSSDRTKQRKFKKLHRVMPLAENIQ